MKSSHHADHLGLSTLVDVPCGIHPLLAPIKSLPKWLSASMTGRLPTLVVAHVPLVGELGQSTPDREAVLEGKKKQIRIAKCYAKQL